SSLNINEEEKGDEKIHHIVTKCQREGLTLIVDINQESLERYGKEGLERLGIKALRIDDGISIEVMKSLSEDFLLVLNASTLSDDFLRKMMDVGI
ncbi:MupG family TIM beta-alpha barrel fold protein, partial [Streptococcus suis]